MNPAIFNFMSNLVLRCYESGTQRRSIVRASVTSSHYFSHLRRQDPHGNRRCVKNPDTRGRRRPLQGCGIGAADLCVKVRSTGARTPCRPFRHCRGPELARKRNKSAQ
jgi:hypothetical protein